MMSNLLKPQYALIKETRQVVFHFLGAQVMGDLIRPVSAFNEKTIAYMYIHIANTYIAWAGNFALKGADGSFDQDEPVTLTALNNMFAQVDDIMGRFIDQFTAQPFQVVEGFKWPGKYIKTDAYSIYTHVITHEFHHKGQAMTMARLLGHLPPDTDVMRF